MSRQAIEVFHALMKKGWIDRQEDNVMFSQASDLDVQKELVDFKTVLGFELSPAGDRIYLIPRQENELFLKSNSDYRRDVGSDAKNSDLCLLNYLSMYLIYLFFNGEGASPRCRDFITKDELVLLFDEHCTAIVNVIPGEDQAQGDISESFRRLAQTWLSKTSNDSSSVKLADKYGVANKALRKLKLDEVFYIDEDEKIRPTRKTVDLMPYFLGVGRIKEIQNWFKEREVNAANQ